jgi:thymidylate kinase
MPINEISKEDEIKNAGGNSSLEDFRKLLKTYRDSPDIGWLAFGATVLDHRGLQDKKMSLFINSVLDQKLMDFMSVNYAAEYSSLEDFGKLLKTFKDSPSAVGWLSQGAADDSKGLQSKKMSLVTTLILDKGVTDSWTAMYAGQYSSVEDFRKLLETFKESTLTDRVEKGETTPVVDLLSQGATDDTQGLRREKMPLLIQSVLDKRTISSRVARDIGQYSSLEEFGQLLDAFKGVKKPDVVFSLGLGAAHGAKGMRRKKEQLIASHTGVSVSSVRDQYSDIPAQKEEVKAEKEAVSPSGTSSTKDQFSLSAEKKRKGLSVKRILSSVRRHHDKPQV